MEKAIIIFGKNKDLAEDNNHEVKVKLHFGDKLLFDEKTGKLYQKITIEILDDDYYDKANSIAVLREDGRFDFPEINTGDSI